MKEKIFKVNQEGFTYYDVENSGKNKFKIGKNVTTSETTSINAVKLKD